MAEEFFSEILPEVNEMDIKDVHLLDYPGNHDAWSDSKKAKYFWNIIAFLYDPSKNDIHNSFMLMVKAGEEYVNVGGCAFVASAPPLRQARRLIGLRPEVVAVPCEHEKCCPGMSPSILQLSTHLEIAKPGRG